jgi:hypothetical protein
MRLIWFASSAIGSALWEVIVSPSFPAQLLGARLGCHSEGNRVMVRFQYFIFSEAIICFQRR